MIVDKAVFDLDSKLSLRIPYKDTERLRDFCKERDIPHTIVFSGGKGFHFYIHTKPVYCVTQKDKEHVKNLLYSVQLSLVNHLGIQSIDLPTIGRLRFPIRLPGTVYINGNKERNGNFCRWITDSEFQKGLDYIVTIAKEGPGKAPSKPKSKFTLEALTELIPKYELKRRYRTTEYIDGADLDIQGGILTPTVNALGCPCMKIAVQEHSPAHHVRVEITSWLKLIGYRDIAIISFFKNVGWKDFNQEKTEANVRTIKGRLPKCTMLREIYGSHLCKKCPIGGRRRSAN
jgi:hypothetical protein